MQMNTAPWVIAFLLTPTACSSIDDLDLPSSPPAGEASP